MLRMVLAVLFRAGAIEITSGGRRFDTYQDAQSRLPFSNISAFRNTIFTPARILDLRMLTQAVTAFEGLTGKTVEVEKNAIAHAIRLWATDELNGILPVEAVVRANHLPVLEWLTEYHNSLQNILEGGAEECVNILVGEGTTLKQSHEIMGRIRTATTESNLNLLKEGRQVSSQIWPILESHGINGGLSDHSHELRDALASDMFYDHMDGMRRHMKPLAQAYSRLYGELHEKRTKVFQDLLEKLTARPEWMLLSDEAKTALIHPLRTRACEALDLPASDLSCRKCNATIGQMESDLDAVDGLRTKVLIRIQELTAPQEKVERVKLSSFFGIGIENEEELEKSIEQLKTHLLKLIAEGVKIILD